MGKSGSRERERGGREGGKRGSRERGRGRERRGEGGREGEREGGGKREGEREGGREIINTQWSNVLSKASALLHDKTYMQQHFHPRSRCTSY